jgi:hypothetical protein
LHAVRHDGVVIPVELAVRLRDAGLAWKPAAGDRFTIPDRGLDDDVFVLSNMTIEVHDFPDGSVIGFNGTVEWALDDVAKDEAVWLPREDQLRVLLGDRFGRLERVAGWYEVTAGKTYVGDTPEEAYGLALLDLLRSGHA